MNIYLKSAVQNLDAHIKALQEIRDQLAHGFAAPVLGVEVFAPQATGSHGGPRLALPGVPVQTLEPESYEARRGRLARELRGQKTKRGGAKTKRGTPNVERSTLNAEAKTAPVVVKPALAIARALPPSQPGDRAKTLGGAMKLIIAAMGTFTREALREALEKDYGSEEFVKDASGSGFPGNLGYWLKSGKLEESLGGVLKVVDREFFGSVEFK